MGGGGGGGKKFRGNFPAKEGGRRIIINVCAGERGRKREEEGGKGEEK